MKILIEKHGGKYRKLKDGIARIFHIQILIVNNKKTNEIYKNIDLNEVSDSFC